MRLQKTKKGKRKVGSHLGQMCQVQRVDIGLSTAVWKMCQARETTSAVVRNCSGLLTAVTTYFSDPLSIGVPYF
jgi:hypothetical protein